MDTINIGAHANSLRIYSRLCMDVSPGPGTVEKEDSRLAKGNTPFSGKHFGIHRNSNS